MQKPGKGPAKVIKTTPGTHTLIIANYGFVSDSREGFVERGNNPDIQVTLQSVDKPVSGIQIENAPKAGRRTVKRADTELSCRPRRPCNLSELEFLELKLSLLPVLQCDEPA
jgi:hypothetical protein